MQHHAFFRFYEELNDFLPLEKQKQSFDYYFNGNPSIKDAIEALGVPHTEVDLILVNGISVSFDYLLKPADYVSVYPVFESRDISPLIRLRPEPLREVKFVLDVHLGKLTRLLRLLGFDSFYRNNLTDDEIIEISLNERRIILTRDRGILKNKTVTHGYYIRNSNPELQASEVCQRFDLYSKIQPFQRCLNCNGLIQPVKKDKIEEFLLLHTRQTFNEFFQCMNCQQIYWKGSHYQRMQEKIERIIQAKTDL
ncbi:Mut7-C ubiquitin/RNAse domain-containing protein [candidate division KSB1 bacterium]|nr:Mut7-C ubiquitin/RNAse domain-containing protein [candidate division KSB1 bacterium]